MTPEEYHQKMREVLATKECDWCDKPAVARWREGQGTGHSETVFACETHKELEH